LAQAGHGVDTVEREGTYNGMLSCFFQGVSLALFRSMASARATRGPGGMRHDHLVDVAALRRDERAT
jgi:hypothetical protein